tara:strand:- start:406 stop:906 length:501 start_codon:yes stop_codon:yes gene_type:complete
MTKNFGKLLLTMFNIGKIKLFPGTIASGITSIMYLFLFNIKINYIILLIFLFLITIISIMLINTLKNEFDEIDSKEIVIDEYIGQSIPLIFFYVILFEASSSTQFFFIIMLVSFIGFRFFDILKPFPINYVDKNIKSGLGVVLDDIIAGIYTTIVLYIFIIIYGKF